MGEQRSLSLIYLTKDTVMKKEGLRPPDSYLPPTLPIRVYLPKIGSIIPPVQPFIEDLGTLKALEQNVKDRFNKPKSGHSCGGTEIG